MFTEKQITEYELKLQELQAGFVEEIMPNAKDLNTAAKTLLLGSIGEQPLDFAEHLNQAHTRYNDAYAALYSGAEWISTYLTELDNHSDVFATANTAFSDALINSWDSESYTDANGTKRRWVGFWDFSAHILYDNADNGMNEIGETLRTVVNGVNQHFHDVINNFQVGFEQEMNNYSKLISTVKGVTFEDTATLNADELEVASKKVGLADQIFINASNELPAVIEDAAVSVNSDFNGRESTVTTHAKTNYTDLDELIPKFTVTSDIVDSLSADAADDLKRVRDANYDDLDTLPTKLDKVESDVRVTLVSYIGDIEPVKILNYDTLNGIADDFKIIISDANNTLENFLDEVEVARDKNYSNLESLPAAYENVTKNAVETLESFLDEVEVARDKNYSNLESIPAAYENVTKNAVETLEYFLDDVEIARDKNYSNLESIPAAYENVTKSANATLTGYIEDIEPKREINYYDLDPLPSLFSDAADSINSDLDGIDDGIKNYLTEHKDNYEEIIPHYLPAAHASNKVIGYVERGKVTDDWQENMQESIKLAIDNSVGKIINDHAKRGILNSSVTNQAIYDIEKNTADEVARQYQQNIQTIAQLADIRWKNIESALNDMKVAFDGILGNYLNGAGQQGQIKQGQFSNINAALLGKLQTYNAQLSNFLSATQQESALEENVYQNGTNTLMDDLKVYDDQLQNYLAATQALMQTQTLRGDNINKVLMNQATVFNYQLNNQLQAANTLAQMYSSRFNNLRTTYADQANLYNARFNNDLNAAMQQATISNNRYTNWTNTLNAKDRIYQEVIKNKYDWLAQDINAMVNSYNLISDSMMKGEQAYSQIMQAAHMWSGDILNYHQQKWVHEIAALKYMVEMFQARTGALSAWNGTWSEAFNRLAQGIALDTAAQEGAQNPALRLWNASVGLNQSATGVLVSMAGQGTKTTTTRESGGDFFSGLLSSATTAFVGGLSSGWANSRF